MTAKLFSPLVAALLALGLAGSSARAAGDVFVHAGANFTPVTIAVTPLAGDDGAVKVGAVIVSCRSIPRVFPRT
ncbi:MAG: hypothetical protein ABR863_04195 [Roseiarcus sp.]